MHSKCIGSGESTAQGYRTEKQEIVCVRVIALLAMAARCIAVNDNAGAGL